MFGDYSSRSSSIPEWATPAAILVIAAVLRVVALDLRPVHFDEGVNGWFVDGMVRHGYYHYDPSNFHGPLHFYSLFVSQTLFGRNLWALRLPTVLVSIACVALIFAYRAFFPRRACHLAALFAAISPGLIYYGRDAIHETWLLFFLILLTWGVIGLWHQGRRKFVWATGLGIAGAIVTKETYLIHFIALGLAAAFLGVIRFATPNRETRGPAPQTWSWRDFFHCTFISAALIVFFYTGAFLDWPDFRVDAEEPRGSLAGLVETFLYWAPRGASDETGHEKPWFYWWELLAVYEWPALGGALAALILVLSRLSSFAAARVESSAAAAPSHRAPAALEDDHARPFAEYLALYAIAAFTAYSIIRYKTPWCLISMIWPFHLLAGIGLDLVMKSVDRVVFAAAGAVIGAHSLITSCQLNFRNFANEDEPYAYVQTLPEVERLLEPLRILVRRNPANYHLLGYIMTPDHHPWPWLLGDFTRIELYDPETIPEPVDADFLLIDEMETEVIEERLQESYFKEPLRVRGNAADSSMLYLNAKTFRVCFPARDPEFVP